MLAQPRGDRVVGLRRPHLAIGNENSGAGLAQRGHGLLPDIGQKLCVVVKHQAARVYHHELPVLPKGATVGAIACHPRLIVNNRIGHPREAVDEGRFAHIGATDNGDNRQGHGDMPSEQLTFVENV